MPKRVLKRWRTIFDDPDRGDDTIIEVLFSSRQSPTQASQTLAESLGIVIAAYEETHTAPVREHGELPYVGEWSVTPVPEGALLYGGRKSDDAGEELLSALAQNLTARGIAGKLDLYQRPCAPPPPDCVTAIAARLRVAGARDESSGQWRIDENALDRLIVAAGDWCLTAPPDHVLTLQSDASPATIFRRSDSPVNRIRDVIPWSLSATLQSIGQARVRSVVISLTFGDLTIVEGGAALLGEGWQSTAAEMTDFICKNRNDVVYARVNRYLRLHAAEHPHDGVERRTYGNTVSRYEDHLAPDIYPIQLLGPRYPTHLPHNDAWQIERLDGGYQLLQTTQPAAWLGQLSLRDALQGSTLPDAELVRRAREVFAPILFPVLDTPGYYDHSDQRPRDVWLPQSIAGQAATFPATPEGHRLAVLRKHDGTTIPDVTIDRGGARIARIGTNTAPDLNPHDIIEIRPDHHS